MENPSLDPEQLLGFTYIKETDEGNYRAEVVSQCEHDAEKYYVKIGDGEREEIIYFSNILAEWENLVDEDKESLTWTFKEIMGHKKINGKWFLNVLWEDDTNTWEPC